MSFLSFFLPYLQDHGLLRSTNFAIMATWRNDFSHWACGNNRYGNIKCNLSWGCVGVVSNYTAKPLMGKEDTYHLVTAWPSGKSSGCCNPEAPSFSPLLAAIWICSRINWNTRLIIASNKIRHEIPFKNQLQKESNTQQFERNEN